MPSLESRSDSTAAALQRAGCFDEYFAWCRASRVSYAKRLAWLMKHGVKASIGSIHRLHRSPEAGVWRVAEAKKDQESFAKNLPEDIKGTFRNYLLQARFNEVMGELTHKELMDHTENEYTEEILALKKRAQDLKEKMDPAKIRLAERRVELLEKAAQKAKETLTQVVTKGGISKDTRKLIEDAMAGLTS